MHDEMKRMKIANSTPLIFTWHKNNLFFQIARLQSTGLEAASPHCSSFRTCEYTDATKQECARVLCNANGYSGGSFVEASNNFCNSSHSSIYSYVYRIDLNSVALRNYNAEAMITADCTISGDSFLTKTRHC